MLAEVSPSFMIIIMTIIMIIIMIRSPDDLLAEVILVDDASTMEHLGKDLDNYMAQYPKAYHHHDHRHDCDHHKC